MSRFYMYDSHTGAYAPVAEFSTRYSREQAKKGNYAMGRDAREAAAQDAYKKSKKAKPKKSLNSRLDRMRANNAYNNPQGYAVALPKGNTDLGRALTAATTGTGMDGTNRGLLREVGARTKNVWRSGKVGKAGLIGAGLLGAGALTGGGIALNNRRKKAKAEAAKSPLRKRYEALLGR